MKKRNAATGSGNPVYWRWTGNSTNYWEYVSSNSPKSFETSMIILSINTNKQNMGLPSASFMDFIRYWVFENQNFIRCQLIMLKFITNETIGKQNRRYYGWSWWYWQRLHRWCLPARGQLLWSGIWMSKKGTKWYPKYWPKEARLNFLNVNTAQFQQVEKTLPTSLLGAHKDWYPY